MHGSIRINTFSFHRPLKEHLKANMKIPGILNAYAKEFFTFTDGSYDNVDVKYIADANHQWRYGIPSKEYFSRYDKVQLVIHPLSWTERGAEHLKCFQEIVCEKHDELVASIESEWKTFDELRGKL